MHVNGGEGGRAPLGTFWGESGTEGIFFGGLGRLRDRFIGINDSAGYGLGERWHGGNILGVWAGWRVDLGGLTN